MLGGARDLRCFSGLVRLRVARGLVGFNFRRNYAVDTKDSSDEHENLEIEREIVMKHKAMSEARALLYEEDSRELRSLNSIDIQEPTLFQAYTRGTVIVANGFLVWGSSFSLVGVGTYQILGGIAGIDVTAFPTDIMAYSFLIGSVLGVSRGILSAVEFGLLQVNILKRLTETYVNWSIPVDKDTFFSCNVQKDLGASEMKKWLVNTAPLDDYRRYLVPVWHKYNLVNELMHNIEPNLKAVDLVVNHRTQGIKLLNKKLLTALIYPHAEVALCHLIQAKKRKSTGFAFTVLCLTTFTLLYTELVKEHLPVVSHFVSIYDQLKQDGMISSNHPVKAYIRDSLVTVLGLVVYMVEKI